MVIASIAVSIVSTPTPPAAGSAGGRCQRVENGRAHRVARRPGALAGGRHVAQAGQRPGAVAVEDRQVGASAAAAPRSQSRSARSARRICGIA